MTPVRLDGRTLGLSEVVAIARARNPVRLDAGAAERMAYCRAVVDRLLAARARVYGLTTGFGSKRDVSIDPEETRDLQLRLLRSHAAGVGDPLDEDEVRAIMVLRANTLAHGHSGIRPLVVERLLEHLAAGVYPFVPAQGSVGASGDLAPLSHLALVLLGDPGGRVYERGPGDQQCAWGGDTVARANPARFVPATAANLARLHQVAPIALEAKEGLALNNGTQVMTGIGVLVLYDGGRLLKTADIACAMSLEALKGVRTAFDARLHALRPFTGQLAAARNVWRLTEHSDVLALPLNTARVQRAVALLGDARFALGLHPTPRTEDASHSLAAVIETLSAVQADPRAHVRAWVERLPTKRREPLGAAPSEDLAAAALRAALDAALARLYALSQSLLSPSLPDDVLPARDFLVAALNQIELAVPKLARVQDNYSLRCAPQVHGAAHDALRHAASQVALEVNAVTDNPLVFPPEPRPGEPLDAYRDRLDLDECRAAVVSGGNFHGEPIALAMDYAAMGLAEIASIAERRIALVTDGNLNNGLPSLLIAESGLNSGYMIPQYTAAALVSENKVLCHPASVDSIPTCENAEDHVSMGTIAARKARSVLRNSELVVAIELMTAYQALHFRRPLEPGVGSRAVMQYLRDVLEVPFVVEDVVLHPYIERVAAAVRSGAVLKVVEDAVGNLDGAVVGQGSGR